MSKTISPNKNLIIIGIPLLIIGILVLIAQSSNFKANPNSLSIGITADLLLTVPVIYFLLIRKTSIPKTTVLPFLILGMVICTMIIPSENQYYLDIFKTWIFPVIELSIVSFIIFNIRKAVKRYRLIKTDSFDFFTTLKNTCYHLLPKGAVIPVVTEIAVFYYGFVYWKKRKLKANQFSYHKDSGSVTLLIAIIFIIAIETITIHIVLSKWNSTVAWIFTVLSMYSGIQIFGFVKSMFKRPISIENNKLFLRYGIMNETTIDLSTIDSIEISSKDIELNTETRKLSFLGALESHNIIIRLKQENTLTGLYGITKNYKNLVLHIDKNIEFHNLINNAIQQYK
ncbi:MAG: hypothetical protein BM564_01225 [Bacteroidetes bacterium MedPE-SWsnd-G2]|nr:MAG: hypothetical protein BM564_01225 [Bacteroidetes bacterium MedPE-SWsnd-G2]